MFLGLLPSKKDKSPVKHIHAYAYFFQRLDFFPEGIPIAVPIYFRDIEYGVICDRIVVYQMPVQGHIVKGIQIDQFLGGVHYGNAICVCHDFQWYLFIVGDQLYFLQFKIGNRFEQDICRGGHLKTGSSI